MSDTYTKLFSSITESTIVSEPVATRWLWVTMLAMADAGGCVYGSVPGLARRANITLQETEAALATFYAPDAYSRTKENEGRRITDIDGGWRLLNHAKYAAIRSEVERADYKREWDRTHRPSGHQRAKQSDDSPTVRQQSDESPNVSDSPTPPTPTPTPVKEEQKKKRRARAVPDLTFVPPDWIDGAAWAGYLDMRRGKRVPPTDRACELVVAELEKLRRLGHDPTAVLQQSTRSSWTDVYPLKNPGTSNATGKPGGRRSAVEQVEDAIRDRRAREADAAGDAAAG